MRVNRVLAAGGSWTDFYFSLAHCKNWPTEWPLKVYVSTRCNPYVIQVWNIRSAITWYDNFIPKRVDSNKFAAEGIRGMLGGLSLRGVEGEAHKNLESSPGSCSSTKWEYLPQEMS